jgi:hypothetical protein
MAAFVAARLDEDEAAAKAAGKKRPGPWRVLSSQPRSIVTAAHQDDLVADSPGGLADHVALHDPPRELREVAAKRARLALMTEAQAKLDGLLTDTANRRDQAEALGRARAATVAVTHDAAVWSDHPDYDQKKWSPDRLKPGP